MLILPHDALVTSCLYVLKKRVLLTESTWRTPLEVLLYYIILYYIILYYIILYYIILYYIILYYIILYYIILYYRGVSDMGFSIFADTDADFAF